MSNFLDKIKGIMPSGNDNKDEDGVKKNKRKTENLVILLILIVIVIISINFIFKEDVDEKKENKDVLKKQTENVTNNANSLEERLKLILNKVKGVSDIDLIISYSSDTKKVPVYNEKNSESVTEESNGSSKKSTSQTDTDKSIAYEESGNSKSPIYEQNITPTIEGVIVVGKGVLNSDVKNTIISAVSTVTGVPLYKVQVLEKGD